MLVASNLAVVVIVILSTVLVVVAVLGLFVWAAIQDGREQKALKATRERQTPR